jgi:carboxylesterase type B
MLGLLISCALSFPFGRAKPVVQLGEATIEGIQKGKALAFYNIPYAQPPVGTLRFEPPVAKILSGKIDATKPGVSCIRSKKSKYTESEDCLQLNVFTPTEKGTGNLPAVVFIHGGGFDGGTAIDPLYDAKAIVKRSKVVFVTMNYRLGIFGFLSGHGGEVNVGLLDQQLAIQWVQQNIQFFGGDAGKITLMGQSAGAISVAAHLLNPNRLAFNRAILLSGGPLLQYPSASEQKVAFDATAKRASCTTSECLKKLDVEKLRELSAIRRWGVVEGGSIVREQATVSLKNNRFAKIPIFIQSVNNEGSFFTQQLTTDAEWVPFTRSSAPFFNEATFKTIDTFYPAEKFQDIKKRSAAWFGDFFFDCPVQLFSRALSRENIEIRNSIFTFETKVPFLNRGLGAFHGSDLPAVFLDRTLLFAAGALDIGVKYHDEILNFAKGQPTLTPLYKDGNRYNLEKKTIVRDDARKEVCEFYLKTMTQ